MWFDVKRLPVVRRTVEGDYDAVLKGVQNSLGTVWINWQSDWLGEPVTTVETPRGRSSTRPTPRRGIRGGWRGSLRDRTFFNTSTDTVRFEER